MNKTLHYLFDPLCDWCYGATPAVSSLLEAPDIVVKLLLTGVPTLIARAMVSQLETA